MPTIVTSMTYQQRMDLLRAAKAQQTQDKQQVLGAMDYDDQGQVLPPAHMTEIVELASGSGITVKQFLWCQGYRGKLQTTPAGTPDLYQSRELYVRCLHGQLPRLPEPRVAS